MIGKFELIILLALVVTMLFVGGKKLPELARGVGESAKELKKGFRDDENEEKSNSQKTTKK
jgi:sec-independent protein translocase protein TatA